MLAGISTRRYPVGLEPVDQRTQRVATATSKSAISRRFVAATETALCELLVAPLGALDLVALMIDGVHFGEHGCVVALGIGLDATLHSLALVEGSTENTTTVTELLVGLLSGVWTRRNRSSSASTARRRCGPRCFGSSTTR
jgi:hypothetical protein